VTYTATVGRHDIDTNRHVNNIHYLDYALEALPEDVAEAPPQTLEVVYRRQILLGTPIRCLYSKTPDGRHQVEVRSGEESDPTHHAYLWLY
jgi:acyl-ACP thioesterase